jgi:hypothetical protein
MNKPFSWGGAALLPGLDVVCARLSVDRCPSGKSSSGKPRSCYILRDWPGKSPAWKNSFRVAIQREAAQATAVTKNIYFFFSEIVHDARIPPHG